MKVLIDLAIGFMAGLITSTLGAYKDTKYEGFSRRKYFRSPIITALMMPLATYLGQSVFFAMFLERLITETWKTFIRPRMPGKFRRNLLT